MYTLLFLLISLCVLTVLWTDRVGRGARALWVATLIATVAAFLPQLLGHTFGLEF
ncbi:hypothetical protein ACFVMC_27455 [Nocardia sp. NPDC127579]|uniref:hypothetical protein n=1 Tax=Nocardia sp. NPDC127579 TaxID=3345402 RepID=UPI003631B6CC